MNNTFMKKIEGQDVAFQRPLVCPRCGARIEAEIIDSFSKQYPKNTYYTIFFRCNVCENIFAGHYELFIFNQKTVLGEVFYSFESRLLYLCPNESKSTTFEPEVDELSPQFSTIYNQALKAENSGLNEICGMGYRKALEFLIKDFAISEHPDKVEDIANLALAKCISEHINNEKIKILAERCAWLGNDETHYVRKHEDYDINTLKSLLDALVHYISSEQKVKLAMAITKK